MIIAIKLNFVDILFCYTYVYCQVPLEIVCNAKINTKDEVQIMVISRNQRWCVHVWIVKT